MMKPLDVKVIYNRLKNSARVRNIPFSLTLTDLNNLTFPVTCPILGMPLVFHTGRVEDDSYSIDRIDSTLGYEIDNIEVISYKANRLKSDATKDEIQHIAKHYTET